MSEILNEAIETPMLLSKEEKKDFNDVFPEIVRNLTAIPDLMDMAETNLWLARILQYNVPHGKQNRGKSEIKLNVR